MKKFSKLTNQKVKEEEVKKLSKKEEELLEKKVAIMEFINNTLSVRTFGRPHPSYNLSVKIEGKEMLADVLLEYFNGYSKKDQVSLLESLKADIKDWKSIDDKITSITLYKNDISQYQKNKKLSEMYNNDLDFKFLVESKLSNIKSKEEILNRYENIMYLLQEKSNLKGLNIIKEVLESLL